jgi:hypothetical protein
MKRKVKRTSILKYWCPIVKREFGGFQWGGHRRVCRCLKRGLGGLMEDLKTIPIAVRIKPPTVGVFEKETVKDAELIVKTVRSYIAALDEEHAKLVVRLGLLRSETGKVEIRMREISAERERIVSSMREIK